ARLRHSVHPRHVDIGQQPVSRLLVKLCNIQRVRSANGFQDVVLLHRKTPATECTTVGLSSTNGDDELLLCFLFRRYSALLPGSFYALADASRLRATGPPKEFSR